MRTQIVTLTGGPQDGDKVSVFKGVNVVHLRDPANQKFGKYRRDAEDAPSFSWAGYRDE